MDLPLSYVCTGCGENFGFGFRSACYHLGPAPLGRQVSGDELLSVPVRPVWCKDCDALSLAEDIASLRDFENAYGAVRAGRRIEYPVRSEYGEPEAVEPAVAAYLRWRMGRRHAARALCCGGSRYQPMDVPRPLIKHATCDFGVVEASRLFPGSGHNSPGIQSPANVRVYTAEGELAGLLAWWQQGENTWTVEPASYPRPVDG